MIRSLIAKVDMISQALSRGKNTKLNSRELPIRDYLVQIFFNYCMQSSALVEECSS